MSVFVNEIDVLLDAAPVRNLDPRGGRVVLIDIDPKEFLIGADGTATPSIAKVTARLVGLRGVIDFSIAGGELTGSNDGERYIAAESMTGATARVTATVIYEGETYTDAATIARAFDGGAGSAATLTPAELLAIASIPEIEAQIDALEEIYGTTSSAATSAADAALAAADAVTAKAAAMVAAGDAVGAASASNLSKLAAEAANEAAGTSANAAFQEATNAAGYADTAGSAAAASNSFRLAAEAASGTADGAAQAAVTARDAAVASADAAGTSASSASTSANTATTKAATAATSATNAATSETNAAGAASNASSSSNDAARSATLADGLAQAASGSASVADTRATAAETSASAANTARIAAEVARDTAAGSASAASTSANTASAKADAASSSASSASTSANTASTRAADAATYRDSAAQSASQANNYAQASAYDYTAIYARLNNTGGTGVSVEQRFSAQADSISGLSGQAVLAVNAGGQIAGIKLAATASTAGATSKMTVVASEVEFVLPGAAAKQMFKVGVVNGQNQMVVADGGVVASSLSIVRLSDASPDVGTLRTRVDNGGGGVEIRSNKIQIFTETNAEAVRMGYLL